MPTIRLSSEPQSPPEAVGRLQDNIDNSNMDVTGVRDYAPIRIFLRDENDQLRGGIVAETWGGWMHITILWIDELLRRQGYGTLLLEAAEAEARALGCRGAYLETFSFQARPFYERAGYQVMAALPDFPPGHTYYFLRKSLTGAEN